MLERRTFHVVFVGKGQGTGLEPPPQPDATITYVGQPATLAAP
jgi:hypothetical protein